MNIKEAKELILNGLKNQEKFSIMVGTQEIYNSLVNLLAELFPENAAETIEISRNTFIYFRDTDLKRKSMKSLIALSLNLIDEIINKIDNYESLNYLNAFQCVYILDYVFKLHLEYLIDYSK